MSITAFAPLFLLMVLYAARGAKQWMSMTLVASFFQAASPLVIQTGGRVGGLTPAYILLGIGFFHWLHTALSYTPRKESGRLVDGQTLWLLALTIVGVAGAIILPRLFEGVMVLPPRGGLDTGFLQAVRAGSGNYIQAFYLVCNFLFFFLVVQFLVWDRFTLTDCLYWLRVGTLLAVFLGIYQIVSYHLNLSFHLKLPWPRSVINSNAGVSQQYEQMFLGVRRMSSTFLEPSQMAFYFVALFALFGLGLKERFIGVLLLICLLLSTSSSAYLGLVGIFFMWIALELWRNSVTVFVTILVLVFAIAAAYGIDVLVTGGQLTDALLFNKLSTVSGVSRAHADFMGFQAMFESYGLGVGIGSARASSLIATLAATMGVPGLLCFFAFVFSTLRSSFIVADTAYRALGYAMVAFVLVWVVSIPDLALPLPWLIAGIICGETRQRSTAGLMPVNASIATDSDVQARVYG